MPYANLLDHGRILVYFLDMTLDDDIRAIVRSEIQEALSNLFQGDRRQAPRKPKKQALIRRAKKLCPAKGCKNTFAPRFGGWCVKHRDTAGFKAWKAKKR